MTILQKTFVGSIIVASALTLNMIVSGSASAVAPNVTYETNSREIKIKFDQPNVKIGSSNIDLDNFKTTYENASDANKLDMIKDLVNFPNALNVANVNVDKALITTTAQSLTIAFDDNLLKADVLQSLDGGLLGNRDGIYRIAFKIDKTKFKSSAGEPATGKMPTSGNLRLQFRAKLDDNLNFNYSDSETRVIEQIDFAGIKDSTNKYLNAINKVKTELAPKLELTEEERGEFQTLSREAWMADFVPELVRYINTALDSKRIITPVVPETPIAPQPTQPAPQSASQPAKVKLPNTGLAKQGFSVAMIGAFVISVVTGVVILKKQ